MQRFPMVFRSLMAGAFLAMAAPAMAQDMPTVLPQNYVLTDILNKQRIDAAIGSRSGASRGKAAGKTPVAARGQTGTATGSRPSVPARVTSYRASPAVSARVRSDFVQWLSAIVGAEGGRKVAAVLGSADPVRNWAQMVGGDGLRPGDLADAMAGYWVLNWVMATGGDNGRAQTLAARDQVRDAIAGSPAFARFDDGRRQQLSELLMLNFLMQQAAYTDALKRQDSATARRLGDAAQQRFQRELGLDLRALSLTDAGFVPAR